MNIAFLGPRVERIARLRAFAPSVFLACCLSQAVAQSAPVPSASIQPAAAAKAYAEYLKAFELAETGSRPAALALLAQSLRLNPQHNPSAQLAFRLLAEQRANTGIRLLGQTGLFTAAIYSPDGATILTTGTDQTARLWNAHTGAPLIQLMQEAEEIVGAVFSADGKHIALATDAGTITVRDTATGKPVLPALAIIGSAASLAFSPDGNEFAAASDRGRVRLWNVRSGQLLHEMEYRREAYRVSFSKDSKSLLIATGDNYTDLRDVQTGESRLKLREGNSVLTAEFDPAGNRILTAGSDSRAHLWNATTGQHDGPAMQFGAAVVYASFSDDGRFILTASRDHTARVWDAATGQPLGATLEHPAPVGRAALSPDGQMVATIAGDKAVRLWTSATGDAVAPPIFFEGGAYATFSPDNRSLLLAGGGMASIVDRAPLTEAPAWLADLAEFASTLNNYNHSRQPDLPRVDAIKAELRASSAHDAWTTFGRWYFTDITVRPVSPWSDLTLEHYVDLLVERGDRASVVYAQALSTPFPSWSAKVNAAMVKLGPVTSVRADSSR